MKERLQHMYALYPMSSWSAHINNRKQIILDQMNMMPEIVKNAFNWKVDACFHLNRRDDNQSRPKRLPGRPRTRWSDFHSSLNSDDL